MRYFQDCLLGLLLLSCSTTEQPVEHWHEIKYGKTIHCYQISELSVSVDRFTFGYSRKVTDKDTYQTMLTNSTFALLQNENTTSDTITVGDSIIWVKMPNNSETFRIDLTVGLHLQVQPPEVLESEFELPYHTAGAKIYIGQLKDSPYQRLLSNQYHIQLNDAIASIDDVEHFLLDHREGNEDRLVILHADRNTPQGILNAVCDKIIRSGYSDKNIYRTVIDSNHYTMGLVRWK